MNLITDAKDERLDIFDYSGRHTDWNLTLHSLRAAITERDALQAQLTRLHEKLDREKVANILFMSIHNFPTRDERQIGGGG